MSKKLKLFRFELDFQQRVRGTLYAKSKKDAEKMIVAGANNPDFDCLRDYTMPSEPDIEIDSIVEDDDS